MARRAHTSANVSCMDMAKDSRDLAHLFRPLRARSAPVSWGEHPGRSLVRRADRRRRPPVGANAAATRAVADRHGAVLAALTKQKQTSRAIARAVNETPTTVRRDLRALKKAGRVKHEHRESGGRSGTDYWWIP